MTAGIEGVAFCMIQKEIEDYLSWKGSYTAKASVTYRVHLERFNGLVKKIISEIGITDIIKFQQMMKNKYAIANVAYATIVIKNFFDFYRRQGIKCIDPFIIRAPKFMPRPHCHITFEEYQKMENTVTRSEFFTLEKRIILRLLWETGIRVSELCDLNIADIENEPKAFIRTKKGNRMRWIFWSPETHRHLMQYLGIRLCMNQREHLFMAGIKGRGIRLTTRSVQRWIKEMASSANLKKKVSPHSLRHSKAHHILDLGGNIVEIMRILGHSRNNPRAALDYLQFNDKEMEKTARKYV